MWLDANQNPSVTSGERIRCSKRIAGANELGSCQSNVCLNEAMHCCKDSFKVCFENVNFFL